MARPKSDDPTVAVAIRLKQSAFQWWSEQAADKKVAKVIQGALEAKAAKAMQETGEVQPRFKKGGK